MVREVLPGLRLAGGYRTDVGEARMERAAAVVLGGIGLVLLTLAAVVLGGPDQARVDGRVELAAISDRPLVTAPSIPNTASLPDAPASTSARATTSAPPATSAAPTTAAPTPATAPPPTTAAATPTTADQPPAARATPTPQPIPPELVELTHEISNGGVRFVFGRADLDAQATALLDRMIPLLRARPDIILLVRGHTDSVGPDEVNRPLSAARAIAVVQYLVAGGVDPAQLQMVGLAADQPLADNATTDGRQLNRRSDLLVEGQR